MTLTHLQSPNLSNSMLNQTRQQNAQYSTIIHRIKHEQLVVNFLYIFLKLFRVLWVCYCTYLETEYQRRHINTITNK